MTVLRTGNTGRMGSVLGSRARSAWRSSALAGWRSRTGRAMWSGARCPRASWRVGRDERRLFSMKFSSGDLARAARAGLGQGHRVQCHGADSAPVILGGSIPEFVVACQEWAAVVLGRFCLDARTVIMTGGAPERIQRPAG